MSVLDMIPDDKILLQLYGKTTFGISWKTTNEKVLEYERSLTGRYYLERGEISGNNVIVSYNKTLVDKPKNVLISCWVYVEKPIGYESFLVFICRSRANENINEVYSDIFINATYDSNTNLEYSEVYINVFNSTTGFSKTYYKDITDIIGNINIFDGWVYVEFIIINNRFVVNITEAMDNPDYTKRPSDNIINLIDVELDIPENEILRGYVANAFALVPTNPNVEIQQKIYLDYMKIYYD